MNATRWRRLSRDERRDILRAEGLGWPEVERRLDDYVGLCLSLGHPPRLLYPHPEREPRPKRKPSARPLRCKCSPPGPAARIWPGQIGVIAGIAAANRPLVFSQRRRAA